MSKQTALLAWEIEDRSHVWRPRKTDEGWAASLLCVGKEKLVANSPYEKAPARFAWGNEKQSVTEPAGEVASWGREYLHFLEFGNPNEQKI